MDQTDFILGFIAFVAVSFVIWIFALFHVATNKNFQDNISKLIWVQIVVFTYIIGAIIYLFFGRPKPEAKETEKIQEVQKEKQLESKEEFSRPQNVEISIREAISYGWTTTKNNLGFFAIISFVTMIIGQSPVWLDKVLAENHPYLSIAYNIILFALSIVTFIGFTRITISFVDGRKSKVSDLFSSYRLFPKYFVASLIYVLLLVGGILLFIVPGFIFVSAYFFYDYLIVDKGMGPIQSLKKSAVLTRGVRKKLFFLFLLLISPIVPYVVLMYFPFADFTTPVFSFIEGIVFSPALYLAAAFLYRKLLPQHAAGKTLTNI